MIKLASIFIQVLLLFTSSFAHSISIVNYDAFQQGDKKAILDLDTGMIWMDFGVNNGKSINSVLDSLNDDLSGWRLPTENEVLCIWGKLENEDLSQIFAIWGANKTPKDNLPFFSWGYFLDDEGYVGAAYIKELPLAAKAFSLGGFYKNGYISYGVEKRVIDVKYDGSAYYPFDTNGSYEISTLLVKNVKVDEPSVTVLYLMSLFVFGCRFLLKREAGT